MKETAYKRYLLGVLLLILTFNYVDRQVLGLVLQDIKVDLKLSDTELGLLSGIAFAFFYSFVGIPIARWADRGNRVAIITITTVLWSAAVAICGLAGNFLQLLLIRVGVAVGEAGCIPPAHSLIADYFVRAERPRAVAIYAQGGPLSLLVGYFLAGWLNQFYGWRATFFAMGLPGLVLATLAWLTLREPRRHARKRRDDDQTGTTVAAQNRNDGGLPVQPRLKEVYGTLVANRTFINLLWCFSVGSFFSYGITQWQAAFFIRSYGLATGELGTWFAIACGLGCIVGTYWGGEWAFRRARNDEQLQLRWMAIMYVSCGITSALTYLSPNSYVALGLLTLSSIGGAAANGPLFAMIQTLVPPRMRATSIAIIFLFANLIGMGLGPLAAGVLSDALRPQFGEESLRYALVALCPGYVWAAWHLWRARRTVTHDVDAALAAHDSAVEPDNVVANPLARAVIA